MCGITGLIKFGSPLGPDHIVEMTRCLGHRGPDDEGYLAVDLCRDPPAVTRLRGPGSTIINELACEEFTGPANLYLGHRRLAIIDLSSAGRQPMSTGDGVWVVYNGEIYNYLELRDELQAEGFRFTTETDTEVLLAAYEKWGEQCVRRFNGDWSFCLLDMKRRVLFLSRDRYGIKPLYFVSDGEHFGFASEIKALLTLPFVRHSLNLETASNFLGLSLIDYSGETLFEDIRQVLPGQNMTVDVRTGSTRTWRYYDLPRSAELGEYDNRKALEYAVHVRELLFDAVRLRLRADVPIGTCLSGGLDSSTIVAIIAEILSTDGRESFQHTFTASFPGQPSDETPYAELVAAATGVRTHLVYPSREGFWSDLPLLLYHQDEPFAGPGFFTQWEVMREASKHVKVTLDGQGGDEVFAGYRNYQVSYLTALLAKGRLGSFASELWGVARRFKSATKVAGEVKSLPFFALPDFLKRRLYGVLRRRDLRGVRETFGRDNRHGLEHIDSLFSCDVNELLAHYMTASSLPHLLKNGDRSSMAHSIEARMPFTDYRLVDFLFPLPAVYKIRNGWTKWLLRLAVEDLLPPEIVWRKDKLGFATPPWSSRREIWDHWFHHTFPRC